MDKFERANQCQEGCYEEVIQQTGSTQKVQTYLLTLSTRGSRDSDRTSQATAAVFARKAITSLAASVSLKEMKMFLNRK